MFSFFKNNEADDEGADKSVVTGENINPVKEYGIPNRLYNDGILPISIIGEIEGHINLTPERKTTKYEHLIPLILEAEQNPDVRGVLLILNTMGGDVEAGLAISELVAGISKPSVSLVLGGGHSIGVPLAVCTDYSLIAPTATMTVHPIRTNGLVIGVAQSFDYFRRMQERIVSFVTAHSGISEQAFLHCLLNSDELVNDIGSILIGKRAVELGLIDAVGSIHDALAKLREFIDAESEKTELQ